MAHTRSRVVAAAEYDDVVDEEAFTEPATVSTASDAGRTHVYAPVVSAVGTTVGRYVILEELGRGGMGVVYAAYDRTLDRKVALKVLRPERDVARNRDRLTEEARAMARLNHPGIVTVHDVAEHDGQIHLAMEFVEGLTLRQWVKRRSPSIAERLRALVVAGEALVAAHAAGLVHRDFKPDNVMIDRDGRIKVLDFGLARAGVTTSSEPPTSPEAGETVRSSSHRDGTIPYMAPEEHALADSDARSDQFSFSVTAYELLFGSRPFAGESPAEVAAEILSGRPRPPPRGIVATTVWRAIERGLSRKPEDRWPDLEALVANLRDDRGASRRRRLGLAASGLAVLGVGYGAWALQPDPLAPCTEAASQIDAQWSPAVRAELDAHLRGFASRFAEVAAERAVARIDEFAGVWRAGRYETCVQGLANPSAEPVAQAEDCFHTASLELDAHLEMLRGDDPRLVEVARQASATLVPPRSCSDFSSTAARRVHASLTPELRARLARIPALQAYARVDEAIREAEALVHEAEVAQHDALYAEASIHLGHLQRDTGELDEAKKTLERAFFIAGAVGDDLGQMAAASGIVDVIGSHGEDVQQAELWASLGRTAARRAGYAAPGDYSELSFALGALHARHGDFEAAEVAFRDALLREERVRDSSDPALCDAMAALGNVLRRRGKTEEARALFDRALSIAEKGGDVSGTRMPVLLNNLGSLEAEEGRHAEAQAHFRRALSLLDEAGFRSGLRVTVLGSLGASLASVGELDEAESMMKDALALSIEMSGPRHPDVATWRNNLGIFLRRRGQLEAAAEELRQALAIREEAFGPDHAAVGTSLHAMAEVQLARGEEDEALASSRRARTIASKAYPEDHPRRLATVSLTASLELKAGHVDEAAAAFREVLPHLDNPVLGATDRVLARFGAAQALAIAGGDDAEQAVSLAQKALDEVDEAKEAAKAGVDRAAIERWLAEQKPRGRTP
jgi:tetratricopeptide (TPR) repeat protein/predicted Ser/Thr protein kinase